MLGLSLFLLTGEIVLLFSFFLVFVGVEIDPCATLTFTSSAVLNL